MSKFMRGLQPLALASLHRLTKDFWPELVEGFADAVGARRLDRRNSRAPVGDQDNYLNFYSRGQSVARVGFTHACEPYCDTHVKYVFESDPPENDQHYARLEGAIIRHPKTGKQLSYEGESMLHQWIERAAKYAGTEKRNALTASSPIILLSSILKWACRHPAKKRMLNAWIASHLNRLGTLSALFFGRPR